MSFFQKLQKPGHNARQQEKPVIHTETIKAAPVRVVSPFNQIRTAANHKTHKQQTRVTHKNAFEASSTGQHVRSRKPDSHTPQPSFSSESDADSADEDLSTSRKRMRLKNSVPKDLSRHIRNRAALDLATENDGTFKMVHASEIATLKKASKYKAAFPGDPQVLHFSLEYPLSSQSEQYELVVPLAQDDFNTLEDIREVVETVTDNYLPVEQAVSVKDDSHGLLRRIKRAVDRLAGNDYIEHLREWNNMLVELRRDGTLITIVDDWQAIDLKLLERIMTQTYSRIVSPRVQELRQYQNGTDNVYGELLPQFISKILKGDTEMKSDQVFVDLGSGVGNCVLQAALEVGCESWGCESMDNACELAELQVQEFKARCRLWGIHPGTIFLERGDFLQNEGIRRILPKADVLLVNNQAFTPRLNENLTALFLDLKDGARIVSLKSFVPAGSKNEARNSGAVYNILEVQEKVYYSNCVSWTDAPGTYYVSTKDSSRIKAK